MKLQVKINKKPINTIRIVRLIRECDSTLTIRHAKDMVEKAIEQDVDDILEFDLPNGTIVDIDIKDYTDDGAFEIIMVQGNEIPDELSLIKKTETNTLKPGTFVLVRDTDNGKWILGIFSHYNDDKLVSSSYPYVVLGGGDYAKCIPFKGNEHLLNTSNPADSLPVPEPKLPTFDNEKKRYRVAFGNEVEDYTDQELYNFIITGVLRNRDIGLFTVIDTERHPLS